MYMQVGVVVVLLYTYDVIILLVMPLVVNHYHIAQNSARFPKLPIS